MTAADSYFLTRQADERGTRYAPPTLARFLGECIAALEARFGPRDRRFTPLGVEIVEGRTGGAGGPLRPPCLWFPSNGEGVRRHVVLLLGPYALRGRGEAEWQLAHESVHLLDPVRGGTTVLEEGVAAWFQNSFAPRGRPASWADDSPDYAEAEMIVKGCEGLFEVVRALRAEGVRLGEIGAEHLRRRGVPRRSADRLAAPFGGDP